MLQNYKYKLNLNGAIHYRTGSCRKSGIFIGTVYFLNSHIWVHFIFITQSSLGVFMYMCMYSPVSYKQCVLMLHRKCLHFMTKFKKVSPLTTPKGKGLLPSSRASSVRLMGYQPLNVCSINDDVEQGRIYSCWGGHRKTKMWRPL
jgi:hypothetical protein